jgi:hypothetical protein
VNFPRFRRSQKKRLAHIVKTGQSWKIIHHVFSTKRELLRTLRGAPSRAHLTLLQSRLSNRAGWLRYSITAIRRQSLADRAG